MTGEMGHEDLPPGGAYVFGPGSYLVVGPKGLLKIGISPDGSLRLVLTGCYASGLKERRDDYEREFIERVYRERFDDNGDWLQGDPWQTVRYSRQRSAR